MENINMIKVLFFMVSRSVCSGRARAAERERRAKEREFIERKINSHCNYRQWWSLVHFVNASEAINLLSVDVFTIRNENQMTKIEAK